MKKKMIPLACSVVILALYTQSYAQQMNIDISSQSLSSAITKFAEQTKLQILVSQDLLQGKIAPTVKGVMEPKDALTQLLKDSNLEVVEKNRTIIIQTKILTTQNLEKIVITGEQEATGTSEDGYRVDNVKSVGPWGEKKLLDTPYSMNVISGNLIENLGINSTDQIFRMNPTTQLLQPYNMNGLSRVMMRGFLIQTAMTDGLLSNNSGQGIFIENIDGIEILTGLSGFMYGVGNIGGTLNYLTKQPTSIPMYSLTIGNYGGEQYYTHADLSGPIDEKGKFGYRLNLMKQDGDTVIENQSIDRWMTSGAVDYKTDNLLVSVDAMYGHDRVNGRLGQFNTTMSYLPTNINNKGLWASPDTFNENNTTRIGTKLLYDINDNFTFRAGYSHQKDDREYIISTVSITSPTTYTISPGYLGASDTITDSIYSYLDSKFDTLGIEHKVTIGINGYENNNYSGYVNGTTSPSNIGNTITGLNLLDSNSANISLGSFDFGSLEMLKTSSTRSKNYIIGDEITFNKQWSALLGINYSNYSVKSFNAVTSQVTSHYDKSASTPSYSLVYKPLENVTTYATYIESLQQGSTVTNSGSTVYTNAGEVFAPVVSKQYEIGAKTELAELLLTTSLFQIDKANAYTENNGNGTFTMFQNGKQTHKGIEATLSGKVTENLTLLGGITLMDVEVRKSTNDSGLAKIPQGIAEEMAKLYAEYNIPFVYGLTVTGGVNYTGKSYLDVNNVKKVPSYITADTGLRYTTKLNGYDTIFRANVTNITDKIYWTSNYSIGAMLGAPRTLSFSATVKF